MDVKVLLEKFFDLFKDFLRLIGLDEIVDKAEAEMDKIISNIKPIE